ncbi:MAG: hypothetical protein HZB33_11220 [Nitrospirae bacterium]|nr:hypothetical protein [Nitrospirota bacterium]
MTTFEKRTQNYLIDKDIVTLVDNGKLFLEDTFEQLQLSGCAYDLRAGNRLTSRNRSITIDLDSEGYIIQPGEVVTIVSKERLDLSDPLLLGIIANSHTQLSQGVFHPISTVDPGFKGPPTITFLNQGNTPYKIREGDRIGKLLLAPIAPHPDRIYGANYRPRVIEGSLEHSLYSERHKLGAVTAEDTKEFLGGPIGELAGRVDNLEKSAELHRTQQSLKRYQILTGGIWLILAGIISGAIGGIIANKWDAILTFLNLTGKSGP